MLDVRCIHRFCATSRHEDLHGFVVIADGTLIERTLNAQQVTKRRASGLPASRRLVPLRISGCQLGSLGECIEVLLFTTVTEPRLVICLIIDHRRTLASPLLFSHRLVGDQIFSEHMLELLWSLQCCGSLFFIQKMPAVTSGGMCSM
jgi:hypothetical protein